MNSILNSNVEIIKTPQNIFYGHIKMFFTIIKCDLKIDLIMSDPHYIKLYFMNLLLYRTGFWPFDMWQIIGNSCKYISSVNTFSE